MTTGLWSEVDRILGDALGRDGTEREAFVERACAGRPELAAEVRSLLAEHDRGGPLDALDALERLGRASSRRSPAGSVGPYRLVREIGRGGMGSVWLAERSDDQFQKQVAVKLLSAGLPVSEALRRFRDERRILASLEHPHIARLLDAGRTDDGLHYIVMELVEGVPITEHCRARALDVPARVALLRTVASAVHFAHQRLVVHRDLEAGEHPGGGRRPAAAPRLRHRQGAGPRFDMTGDRAAAAPRLAGLRQPRAAARPAGDHRRATSTPWASSAASCLPAACPTDRRPTPRPPAPSRGASRPTRRSAGRPRRGSWAISTRSC